MEFSDLQITKLIGESQIRINKIKQNLKNKIRIKNKKKETNK